MREEFGKTPPTIRRALQFAKEMDERFAEMPKKMPRARWDEVHAEEVAAKKAEGLGTNELAKHFSKSDTTIRKALEYAKEMAKRKKGDN